MPANKINANQPARSLVIIFKNNKFWGLSQFVKYRPNKAIKTHPEVEFFQYGQNDRAQVNRSALLLFSGHSDFDDGQ